MKKLLVLLFSLLISFNSYGLFGFFEDTACVDTDTLKRDDLIYLTNETKPFTGNNLCKYENGQNKSEGKVKDGKKEGKWTYWKGNGAKTSEENLKDGKEDGTWYYWHANGQKSSQRNYKDGKLDGKLYDWYEDGDIESEKTWQNGVCIIGDCPD